jgi:hypothetical protein
MMHAMLGRTGRLCCCFLVSAAACTSTGKGDPRAERHSDGVAAKGGARPLACALVSKAEMEALVGASFASVTDQTEKGQSSTECLYEPPEAAMAPRVVLGIDWAESLVDAKAGMMGAGLGGSLSQKAAGLSDSAGFSAMHPGSVQGLGDDASVTANLLTVRKGATLIHIQAFLISDPMKMVMDTAAIHDQLEKEIAIARTVLAKL